MLLRCTSRMAIIITMHGRDDAPSCKLTHDTGGPSRVTRRWPSERGAQEPHDKYTNEERDHYRRVPRNREYDRKKTGA